MSDKTPNERPTRPEAHRTEPNRGAQGLFGNPNADAYKVDEELINRGAEQARQYAQQGVQYGYDVLQETMGDQSRHQQGSTGGYANYQGWSYQQPPGMNLMATYGQMWRDYMSLLTSSVQSMMSMSQFPAAPPMQGLNPYQPYNNAHYLQTQGAPQPQWYEQPQRQQSTNRYEPHARSYEPIALTFSIESDRPVEVSPHWNSGLVPTGPLVIHGPYLIGPVSGEPQEVLNVTLDQQHEKAAIMRITVDESTCSGVYSGLIVNESGEEQGYLHIAVRDKNATSDR